MGNWENWGRRVSGHPGTSPWDCTEVGGQAAVTGFFCFTVRGVRPQWKLHWRQCGSRGKSPRVGPVPWSTSQTARQVQDGSLEALPQGSVVRQGSHMKSGQPGHSACLPVASRLRPAPALGKQLRKSSGNTNPPPSPSCSLRPDPPTHSRAPTRGLSHRSVPAQHGWSWQGPVGMIVRPRLPAGPVTPSGPTDPAPPQEDLGTRA